jgi:hypothetical protein
MTIHEFLADLGDDSVFPLHLAKSDDGTHSISTPMKKLGKGKYYVAVELKDSLDYAISVEVFRDQEFKFKSEGFEDSKIKIEGVRRARRSLDCGCPRCLEAAHL